MENKESYFIYIGRLEEIKGTPLLLEAWKRMGNAAKKLFVCGTGDLENWCKQFLIDNPQCNIELLGFVPNTRVKELLSGAQALILPTQVYEGFPMVILEAYSVGTPVIGSDLGNAGDLIEEGLTGCKFDPKSADALIAAVNRIQIYPEMKNTVYHEYQTKYDQRINYTMLSSIYQKILYKNKTSAR